MRLRILKFYQTSQQSRKYRQQWKKVPIKTKNQNAIDWFCFLEPVKKTRQQDLDARLAQLQAKKGNFINFLMLNSVNSFSPILMILRFTAAAATSKPTVSEPAPAPVAPPKRNSRLMTPSEPGRARPGSGRSSEVIKPQPDSGTVSPPAPARKTNRKTQKT